MKVTETFEVQGHKKIRGTHLSTFEFTTEPYLTWKGNCIVGVYATKAVSHLSSHFKAVARNSQTIIHVKMEVNGIVEEAIGRGHPSLSYTDSTSLVVRKSRFTCSRTLMVFSNKGAATLSRKVIELMRNPQSKMEVTLIAKPI